MTFCANTYLANQHVKSHDEDSYWLELRNELISDDCNPFNRLNFLEAIGECGNDELASLIPLLTAGEFEKAGKELAHIVRYYWLNIADKRAEEQLDAYISERTEHPGCR